MTILKLILYSIFSFILLRSSYFIYQSLHWPLEYCIDMVLMKFFAWSFDKGLYPYTDIFTYNLPVTIYINYFGLKLFGDTSFGFRLLDASWMLFFALVSYFYFRRLSFFAGFIGFVFTLLLPENATNFGAFQRETMILPFWILALLSTESIIKNENKRWNFFLLGTYCIFSFLIKPTAILLFLGCQLNLFLYFIKSKKTISYFKFNFLYFVLGSLFSLGVCVSPFLLKRNLIASTLSWFRYFIDLSNSLEIKSANLLLSQIFTFSLKDWNLPLNQPVVEYFTTGHLGIFHALILFLFFVLYYLKKFNSSIIILLISSLGNYLIQGKGFAYHLFPLWFSIFAMCILILNYFLSITETGQNKIVKFIAIIGIIFISLSLLSQQNKSLRMYKNTGLFKGFSEEKKVLEKSLLLTKLDEITKKLSKTPIRIQVFEAYHSISLKAVMDLNLELVSKYPEAYIFYNEAKEMQKYKTDMMNSLASKPPDIIVINQEGTFQEKKDLFLSFPELKIFLNQYKIESTILDLNNVTYQVFLKTQVVK